MRASKGDGFGAQAASFEARLRRAPQDDGSYVGFCVLAAISSAVMISRLHMLMNFFREPLFRLLAINLAIGVSIAALMLGGLLALNPHGLRDLIIADRSPLVATGLLLFGLIVTFGSVAMGTAIMMIGQGDGRGGKPKSAPVQVGIGARQAAYPSSAGNAGQG